MDNGEFQKQVRKALNDFVENLEQQDIPRGRLKAVKKSREAIFKLMADGMDTNALVHSMLGLIAAMVMRTCGEDAQEEARSDMLEAFKDYMTIHMPDDVPGVAQGDGPFVSSTVH